MAERGTNEYRALSYALERVTPDCSGDPRFILGPHEIAADELRNISIRICRPCPLNALCAAYGTAARPKAGIWAGRVYREYRRGTEQ